MNRASIIALAIGAMLFGCGVGMVAHEVMEPEEAVAYEGQKWKYKCEKLWNDPRHLTEPEGQEKLEARGSEGWELVQAGIGFGESNMGIACFKRPQN